LSAPSVEKSVRDSAARLPKSFPDSFHIGITRDFGSLAAESRTAIMHRNSTSHRWNGKHAAEKSSENRYTKGESVVHWNMNGKPKNGRTLVIFRVSNNSSTTLNQKFGLDRLLATMEFEPAVIDIQASNWKRPIPEFTQLMKDIEANKYDEIILWKTDRLGRNHTYDVKLWDLCKEHNIRLKFIEDRIDSFEAKDENRFLQLSLDAKVERDRISERTKLRFDRNKAEWVKQTFPTKHQAYMTAVALDATDKGKRAATMYQQLISEAKALGKPQTRPCGGGKVLGNIQKKTVQLLPVIKTLHASGMSVRKMSMSLGINYRTIANVIKTKLD
jgi:DNA invertase Pin-like site-specific DNA recombinase